MAPSRRITFDLGCRGEKGEPKHDSIKLKLELLLVRQILLNQGKLQARDILVDFTTLSSKNIQVVH